MIKYYNYVRTHFYLVSPIDTPTLHIRSCFKLLMMLLFPTFGKPTNGKSTEQKALCIILVITKFPLPYFRFA